MNKQITDLISPYTLNLGNVDTSQSAQNYIALRCSGTGVVVNMLNQSSIPGNPDTYITANPAGDVTVNLGGGDVAYVGGSAVTTFTVAAGTNAYLRPLSEGIWCLQQN